LIYPRTAPNALGVVNGSGFFFVHRNCLDLARVLAGTLAADDCGVGANLGARATFAAFGFIDVCHVVVVKGESTKLAHVLTTVSQASAAGVGYFISANGAFIASDVNDLNDVGVAFVATHCNFDAFTENGSLLVNTATHGGLLSGSELLGNVHYVLQKLILPRKASYLA
jgi:hypothetical protein